jgi:hypothetical protein
MDYPATKLTTTLSLLLLTLAATNTAAESFSYDLTHDLVSRVTRVEIDRDNIASYEYRANGQLQRVSLTGSAVPPPTSLTLTAGPIIAETGQPAQTAIQATGGIQGEQYGYNITIQPTRGSATIANKTLTYTSNPDYVGADRIEITATDSTQTPVATASVPVTVYQPDSLPTAYDDFATLDLSAATTVSLSPLDNDLYISGDSLTLTGVTQGTHGGVEFEAGVVTYSPDLGFTGFDQFSYTIIDRRGRSSSATVRVRVTAGSVPQEYAIGGTILARGAPLSGVSFPDAGVPCLDSDAEGAYYCLVPASWSGSLSPRKEGYRFTPPISTYANVLADARAQDFAARADDQPPLVVTSIPADDATGVSPRAAITLRFDEPILSHTAFDDIALSSDDGPVPFASQVEQDTLAVTPSAPLADGTRYSLSVPPAAVADTSGNALAAAYHLEFTTSEAAVPPTIAIIEPDGNEDTSVGTFTITWTDEDPDSDAEVRLYYDTDARGADGTPITAGLSEDDQIDSYIWDTSGLPKGRYYVYAVIDDGINPPVSSYSEHPVTVFYVPAPASRIASGPDHNVLVREDGSVWAWGRNSHGQLGDGSNQNRSIGVRVEGLDHVVAVASGVDYTLALKDDGSVWAWGSNTDGQLGTDSTDSSNVPVRVRGLADVMSIAADGWHSLAVKSDGTLWTWGKNHRNQLGHGPGGSTDELLPGQVPGLDEVKQAAAGYDFSYVRKTDRSVWSWGMGLQPRRRVGFSGWSEQAETRAGDGQRWWILHTAK